MEILKTSHMVLRILCAMVWYIGVLVLTVKSSSLMLEVYRGGTHQSWVILSFGIGIAIGWFKAEYLFERLCIKNLKRIDSLKNPRIWQFYRPRFFFFLFLMILSGRYLPVVIQGDSFMLTLLAILELSIATALLISSRCFWKTRVKEHGI